jgi:hypothetical protein
LLPASGSAHHQLDCTFEVAKLAPHPVSLDPHRPRNIDIQPGIDPRSDAPDEATHRRDLSLAFDDATKPDSAHGLSPDFSG